MEESSSNISAEKKDDIVRFKDYYECIDELDFSKGDPEPLYIKSMRPFLLLGEAGSNGLINYSKMKGRGKAKSAKKGRSGVNNISEMVSMFTGSSKMPNLNNYQKSNKPYSITQELTIGTAFTNSTASATFGGQYFTIGFLDQTSSLTAVFDQYRIICIETWLIPQELSNLSGTYGTGNLYSVIDYDDANPLTTIGQANDYTNVMCTTSNQGHYRRFTPHVAVATYSGAFTSYGNVEAPWIDATSTSVQHYGLKFASTAAGTAQAFNLQVRYHCEWRNVR